LARRSTAPTSSPAALNGSTAAATIPSRYLFYAYDTAAELGYHVEQGLLRLGLKAGDSTDLEARIPADTFDEAMGWLLARVDHPGFGLVVGHKQGLAQHGMFGFALLTSANLEQAIDVCRKYELVVSSTFSASLTVERESAVVRWQPSQPLEPFFTYYAEEHAANWQRITSVLLEEEAGFTEVCFPYPAPAYAEMYRNLFGCPVRFDADELRMGLPAKCLSVPFKFANEAALEVWRGECDAMLRRIGGEPGLVQEVRELLLSKPGAFAELDELARELNMSPRTLRRRLEEVGTSYRRLVLQLRMEVARQYLSNSDLTFQQIASMVNYSQVSHFHQAFRRWSGMTPGEYRSTKTTTQ
jgi:AraC-like DNA-binding protein